MKTLDLPTRAELVALFGLPVAWLLPWTVHGLMIFVGYVEFFPEWSAWVEINWYWAGFVCVPLAGAIVSWSSVGSFLRATAVFLGTAISYAVFAAFSMIVLITVWTLVDGPFLEGY